MSAVFFDNVSHRYGGSWVLLRLSLRLPLGARVLLTGGNGAGKTTLLRLMATALRPSYGEVRLFGLDAQRDAPALRRRLGLMTHQHHFYAGLSGVQNLRLVARLVGLDDAEAHGVVADTLERVGLAAAGTAAISGYSAGMVRRLALGRMLLLRPQLALFDEPFGQLDAAGVKLVEDVLAELAAGGATWVMSSHDVARARPLCQMQVHLAAGRAEVSGGPVDAAPAPQAMQRAEAK